ncbi:MAG TPA: M48 family metalloprotease [Nitrospira sp.]|nr:M48 family metalloprotease [Nitrospira sp.]
MMPTCLVYRIVTAALMTGLLLAISGCSTFLGSWDYGLPKDEASTEDRLWHIVFPLSIAAADTCVFKREDTYGFFLKEDVSAQQGATTTDTNAVVRFVHPHLPAGRAGMAIGDAIVTINGDALIFPRAETVSSQIQRLTRARIQPLTLGLRRGTSDREVNLWSVPSCRMLVRLVNSPVINAFSDGSNIVLTTGMLGFVRSPDQLAWVIAHEVGHHVLEHAESAKLQIMLNRFLGSTVGEKPIDIRQIDLERQADVFAADLMTRAGFDLREVRRLLEWTMVLQPGSPSTDLNRSHPTNEERLKSLDRMIADLDAKSAAPKHCSNC